jgi:hypothetical protein
MVDQRNRFIVIQQALMMASGSGYPVEGAYFSNPAPPPSINYMTRGSGLVGAADSKTGIFSVWLNPALGPRQNAALLVGDLSSGKVYIYLRHPLGDTTIAYFVVETSTAGFCSTVTPADIPVNAGWIHILCSWDTSTNTRHIYVDDVVNQDPSSFSNNNIDYTNPDWGVGNIFSDSYQGDMAELYFAPGQFLDFSVVANRRKFISVYGKPVDLGATGSIPTGTAPIMYHHIADGGTANTEFPVNKGTGGNFTVTGTLTNSSTSPSD